MKFTIKNRTVVIEDNGNTITLDGNDIRNITRAYDKAFYYREDVENQIEILIGEKELPEEAYTNEKYIQAVVDIYAENREEYGDGSDENLSWAECLNEAFDKVNYSDYTS